jgi:hypothetical protein
MPRLLAIDPGNDQSAWVELVDGKPAKVGTLHNADVLDLLRHAWAPEWPLAIEMIASYGMPVGREVFETCVWVGQFKEAWEARHGCVRLVYRREVKMRLCGNNSAKDANVRQAIIDHFGPGKEKAIGKKKSPGPLYGVSGDQWAALGVALTVQEEVNRKPFERAA